MLLLRRMLVEDVGEDGGDVILGDELLLIDALHQLAAQAIDRSRCLFITSSYSSRCLRDLEVVGLPPASGSARWPG